MLKVENKITSKVMSKKDLIVSLDSAFPNKELLGNKGAKLVEMHSLGINVPQSLFLTTKTCQMVHHFQSVDFYKTLRELMLMFDTDKIAIRSSGVVSMAGMMDTVLNIDKNDEESVCKAILDVVNSWDNPKAKLYRKINKLDDTPQIAIVIQPVIEAKKGFSGIMFSRNPNTGENDLTGEFLLNEYGDKLAEGTASATDIYELEHSDLTELLIIASDLESHYKSVQDIEFVNDGLQTYVVQCRSAKLTSKARVKTLIDFYDSGIINLVEFLEQFDEKYLDECIETLFVDAEVISNGTGAVSGVVQGKVAFDLTQVKSIKSTNNGNDKVILFTEMTTTDDLEVIQMVDALVTETGSLTSHPAVVSREMNKPCIVCVGESINTLKAFDKVTIDGDTGKIYKGHVTIKKRKIFEDDIARILGKKGRG